MTPEPRRRFVKLSPKLGTRAQGDGGATTLVGHAAVFDSETTLYDGRFLRLREVVRRGAFSRAIAEGQDVVANVNHVDGQMIGRSVSGTLRLSEDAVGLAVEIDLPDTTLGRDVAALIARGDLSGMSFAFLPAPGGERSLTTSLEDGRDDVFTELTDLDLYDVSVVARPAYDATDVSARAAGLEADHRRRERDALVASRTAKLDALKARALTKTA